MGYRDIPDGQYEMMFLVQCQLDELFYYDKDDQFYNCHLGEWSQVDYREWLNDHLQEDLIQDFADVQCVHTLKKQFETLTYNREMQMLELPKRIDNYKIQTMKDRLRALNSRLIDMQLQIDEITELSHRIQEELFDIQDKQLQQHYGA